jgi:hypothetical protein
VSARRHPATIRASGKGDCPSFLKETVPFSRRRLSGAVLTATLAVLTAGCGLSHYQQQMAEEQQRIDTLDREFNELDEPVQLPEKKDRPSYFFRPPKNIASSGPLYENSKIPLYRLGLKTNAASDFQEVAFGVERKKDKDFESEFLGSFPGKKADDALIVFKETPHRQQKLRLKEFKSDDGLSYGYIWSQGDLNAGVIYRLTRAGDENARKRMDISLGTLTVGQGAEVTRLHRAFQERKKQAADAEIRRKAAARTD